MSEDAATKEQKRIEALMAKRAAGQSTGTTVTVQSAPKQERPVTTTQKPTQAARAPQPQQQPTPTPSSTNTNNSGSRNSSAPDDFEAKLRAQRDQWKVDTAGAHREWQNVGRGGAQTKVNPSSNVSNLSFAAAIANLTESVGDDTPDQTITYQTRTQVSKPTETKRVFVERELPAHLAEDPFSKIDEVLRRDNIVDAEAVRRREEESRMEREKVAKNKQQKIDDDRAALERARREEDRIQRERDERRRKDQIELENLKKEQQRKKDSAISFTPSTSISSPLPSLDDFDLGLGDLNNLTSELDNIIGSITTESKGQKVEDQLAKQKRIREEERRRVEVELEQKRDREDQQRLAEEKLREESRQRKLDEVAAQRQRQLVLEQEADERETRMLLTKFQKQHEQREEAKNPRSWNSNLNSKLDFLMQKITQFTQVPYTQTLGMEYVNAMKDVSNAIDDVFPLLSGGDVRTVAGQMKQMVMLSTEFVNSAKNKDKVREDEMKFLGAKRELEVLLMDIKSGVARSVSEAVTEKKQDGSKAQLLSDIREAAMDGVTAGEYLQRDEIPVRELEAVARGLVEKSNEIAGGLEDKELSRQLVVTCGGVEVSLEKLVKAPGDGVNRAGLITAIGAWLSILQVVQQNQL